jgi:uncharacterized protein (DUF952 family)
MSILYRILDKISWEQAQAEGKVPRCSSDERAGHVHLNTREHVETVAKAFFEPNEEPIVLEVDTSSFARNVVWYPPTDEKPWDQPCAKIDAIPLDAVLRTHGLKSIETNTGCTYELI